MSSHRYYQLLPILIVVTLNLIVPDYFDQIDLAQAADPPLAIVDYWQKVEQTRTLLSNLENPLSKPQQDQLQQLASEWEMITEVALSDGTILAVEHRYLAAQLRSNPVELRHIASQLQTLLIVRQAWAPSPKHGPDDLQALEKILARSEFQWQPDPPSPVALLWQKVREFIWNFLSDLLPDNGLIWANGDLLRYGLIALGGAVILLVLAFIGHTILNDLVVQVEAEREGVEDEIMTADSAFKKAQALSNTGDYRTAVRYLYLSSLLILDERTLLRYDRSKTNREYLRSVAHLPKLAAILREVIEVFDRVWYGYQPLDESSYSRYAARVKELRQQR